MTSRILYACLVCRSRRVPGDTLEPNDYQCERLHCAQCGHSTTHVPVLLEPNGIGGQREIYLVPGIS